MESDILEMCAVHTPIMLALGKEKAKVQGHPSCVSE